MTDEHRAFLLPYALALAKASRSYNRAIPGPNEPALVLADVDIDKHAEILMLQAGMNIAQSHFTAAQNWVASDALNSRAVGTSLTNHGAVVGNA